MPSSFNILFAMPSPEYLRYYDATIRLLADRGHRVSVAIGQQKEKKHARLDGLVGNEVRFAGFLPPPAGLWRVLAADIRGTMDFLRYLDPRFVNAPALRDRMKRKALPWYLHWLDRLGSIPSHRLRRAQAYLAAAERAVPCQRAITAFIERESPDLLVVSPLVEAGSDQVDLIKVARRLGIPSAVGIASWDNLTNKGLLRIQPDALLMWNDAQRREAVELHGMDPSRIVTTGAQPFDRWFDREPSRTREDFCGAVGLPSDRPIVLFTGSSVFISRGDVELRFVRRWMTALRRSGSAVVRDASVLIRPHPYNADQWVDEDLSDLGPVAVWPRGRHNPVDEQNRAGYFDSLFHSAAIVGINTSALIEGAIVGRPVLSIQAEEFARTQEGTLHFHHLLPEHGGFLRVASTLDDHVAQLAAVIERPDLVRAQIAAFVASFVRPHGVDRPAVPLVADALQRVAAGGRRVPARATTGQWLGRLLLAPVAILSWAADRFEPAGHLILRPRRLGGKARKWLLGVPHRARLGTRRAGRAAVRTLRRTAIHGSRRLGRAARQVARVILLQPIRLVARAAARLRVAVTAGPPSKPAP